MPRKHNSKNTLFSCSMLKVLSKLIIVSLFSRYKSMCKNLKIKYHASHCPLKSESLNIDLLSIEIKWNLHTIHILKCLWCHYMENQSLSFVSTNISLRLYLFNSSNSYFIKTWKQPGNIFIIFTASYFSP